MKKGPRKIRRDDKLKGLPEEQREMISGWFAEDGPQSCLQRMHSELGIQSNQTSLYDALAFWRAEKRFTKFESVARAQAQHEAAAKGGMTAAEMEEAVDRNFIMLAAEMEDPELYKELRYLRIADQASKHKGQMDVAKLRQADAKIRQKNEELALQLRRVQLMETREQKAKEVLGDGALSLEQRQAKIKEIFGVQ